MKRLLCFLLLITTLNSCTDKKAKDKEAIKETSFLTVLGTVQDAGSPQITCKKHCCKNLFKNLDNSRKVTSLGLIDGDKKFLFEATPDIVFQIRSLYNFSKNKSTEIPDGIFLTHAHIGHYTGLMYFGKEAMNADQIPTYVMPKMEGFLNDNGPWSQLVSNKNILLKKLEHQQELQLTKNIKVIPFLVPHRDEYSETVGYKIIGSNKSALFIPDIDKWEKWDKNIIDEIQKVDYAFLDATFFDAKELNNRDISQIPHPFVSESLKKFSSLSKSQKEKIIFIHFNHTNQLLNTDSSEYKEVIKKGYKVAKINDVFGL